MFKLIWSAMTGGSIMEWVALGLSLVVLVATAGGYGFYQGTLTCVTAQAKVTATVASQATAAQAKQDDKDYNQGVEDGIALGASRQRSADATDLLKARATNAVKPIAPGCPPQFIPADVMAGLNDSKIIGVGENP